MATDNDKKDELDEKADEASSDSSASDSDTEKKEDMVVAAKAGASTADEAAPDAPVLADAPAEEVREATPMQFGTRRFVYAAYFAGAIVIAFLGSKIGNLAWSRLEVYKPEIGDPHDDWIMPIAALLGAGVAFYYWRKQQTRQYAEEVASELAQVTWPSRQEVTNSTTVVIIATAFATIFFALMDRFWAFVTDLVYRF